MFIPRSLYEVILIIPQKYNDTLLSRLGEEEIVQIKEFGERYDKIPSVEYPLIDTASAVKTLMRLDYMIDKLGIMTAKPAKKSQRPISEANELLDRIESDIENVNKEIEDEKTNLQKLELSLEFLNSVKKLKLSEENMSFLIDISDEKWEQISKKLKDGNITYSSLKKRITGERMLRYVTFRNEDYDKAVNILDVEGSFQGTLKEIVKNLKKEIEISNAKIEKTKKKSENLPQVYASNLFSLREQIQLFLNMQENKRKFLNSEFISLINLWVARNDFKRLKKIVSTVTNNNFVMYKEKPKAEDNPPTKLANYFFMKPFEMLLEGFSLPGYKDIDPTFIIALFFPIFFGIMLSDVGYGLILLAISLGLILWKKEVRDFGEILLVCSVATIFAGYYFGSWFGFSWNEAYLDPLKKPIELMAISLIIGIFYVNLSLLLGIVQAAIKKEWRTLFDENIVWILFELGIVLTVFSDYNYVIGGVKLNTALIVLPVIYRVLTKGVLNVLDFSKFISTIISFIRLSALAMSTAWISFAINLIFRMVSGFQNGIIFGVIVLIIGHAFNFAFNTFGSFLQAMRLHYVEFLGQFYQGKGHKMKAFSLEKKYSV